MARNLWRGRGASTVEYAMLLLVIAVVSLLAIAYAGEELSTAYSGIASSVQAASS